MSSNRETYSLHQEMLKPVDTCIKKKKNLDPLTHNINKINLIKFILKSKNNKIPRGKYRRKSL